MAEKSTPANVYTKLQMVKTLLSKANLKKTGRASGKITYEYFELGDFLPQIVQFCNDQKLCTVVSYDTDYATLTIINTENPDDRLEVKTPMEKAQVGNNPVQGLGAAQTYLRRYLYMAAFDIIESDYFDGAGVDNDQPRKAQKPQQDQLPRTPIYQRLLDLWVKMGYGGANLDNWIVSSAKDKHVPINDELYKDLGKFLKNSAEQAKGAQQ